uniref:U3 small nucleolar RNA-associated protein 14 homolog A n=1 Tax=Arcella intermedia TaxID=1963864 RepID=A0A6B2KY25_9EUKA
MDDLVNRLDDRLEFKQTKKSLTAMTQVHPLQEMPSKVHSDRQVRQAQYEMTSKEISEWEPTVAAMKDAPSISFPLNPPKDPKLSVSSLANNFEPQNEMEREILKATKETVMVKEDVLSHLNLNLTQEEAKANFDKEVKLRHLILYKQRKLAMHKKIKSRKFRKILRKQKEKYKLTLEEMKELDPSAANEEINKQEKTRALERITLRHKTTGKWARGVAKSKNPHLKQQLSDTHLMGRSLQKKIQKVEDASESEGDSSEEEEEASVEEKPTGLMAMRFMQRGLEREKMEYNQMKQEFDKEQEERIGKLEAAARKLRNLEDDVVDTVAPQPDGEAEEGRRNIETKPKAKSKHNEDDLTDFDPASLKTGFTSKVSQPIVITTTTRKNPTEVKEAPQVFQIPDFPQENEGNAETEGKSYTINQTKLKVQQKQPEPEQVQPKKGRKQKKLKETEKEQENALPVDGPVPVAPNPWMDPETAAAKKETFVVLTEKQKIKLRKKKRREWLKKQGEKGPAEVKKEKVVKLDLKKLEEKASQFNQKTDKEGKSLNVLGNKDQQDIIYRAFAGDDVQLEFENEKKKALQDQLPKDELELDLPGWGNWAGEGIQWKPTPNDLKKLSKKEQTQKELLAKRKDAAMPNVIINESKNPAIEKHKTFLPPKGLSKELYTRNFATPLGREWNPITTHKKMVKPRVLVKRGTIINPIEKKIEDDEE